CDREEWQGCLDALDEAARLDPAGDTAKDVAEMRGRATRGLVPPVTPTGKIDEKLAPPIAPKSELAPQPTSVPPPVTKPAPKPTTPFDSKSKAAPSPKKSPGKSVFDSDFK
ncbi:MAG TPA: hypothetical protein VK459_05715, partial [Polyangiaceae bacterium]|nr:hypothetical protein [Polyangiaceae bacterium]